MEPPDVDYGFDYDDHGCCEDCDKQHYTRQEMSEYYGHEYDYLDKPVDSDDQFEKMWPTVEAVCLSLMRNPREWELSSYTLMHKPTKQQYWTGSGINPITDVYIDGSARRVFSNEQGEKIRNAVDNRNLYTPSDEQLAVMKAFGTAPMPFKSEPGFWSNLWVAIKFLPTLARFCMSRK